MKCVIAVLSLSLAASAASGGEVLREISWSRLKEQGLLSSGEVRQAGDASESLEVTNAEPQLRTFTLLTVGDPGIAKKRWAITGRVSYEGVEGTGYLEMWSTFPSVGSYFSRTLNSVGPMMSLKGSSTWRVFVVPFFSEEGAPSPKTLTFNLVLPGRGTVRLSPLRLVEYEGKEDPLAAAGAWWGSRTAGLVGGLVGSLVGCMGALVGFLASKGKGRGLALGLMKAILCMGGVSLVFGVVALLRSQPYEVVYPLLLEGSLCLGLPLALSSSLRRRYEEIELRKMQAQDLAPRSPA